MSLVLLELGFCRLLTWLIDFLTNFYKKLIFSLPSTYYVLQHNNLMVNDEV